MNAAIKSRVNHDLKDERWKTFLRLRELRRNSFRSSWKMRRFAQKNQFAKDRLGYWNQVCKMDLMVLREFTWEKYLAKIS